jgi:hypothetical protein
MNSIINNTDEWWLYLFTSRLFFVNSLSSFFLRAGLDSSVMLVARERCLEPFGQIDPANPGGVAATLVQQLSAPLRP